MKFIFLFIMLSTILMGCSNNDYINDNLAEVREILYEGKVDDTKATFISGRREKEYVLNGYATELIEFGILTFDIEGIEAYDYSNANFVLVVGTTKYDGLLQKNPFDDTLVADIKKIINVDDNILAKVIMGDFVRETKLARVDNSWEIKSDDVIKIISKNFKNEINTIVEDNIFKGEVYIKILNDADIYKGDYYWYVSIINRSGGKLNAIISPHSGQILSSNNTLDKL